MGCDGKRTLKILIHGEYGSLIGHCAATQQNNLFGQRLETKQNFELEGVKDQGKNGKTIGYWGERERAPFSIVDSTAALS